MKTAQKLFVCLAAGLAAFAIAEVKLTPSALLKAADEKDGKVVVVVGKVSSFEQKTSRAGNPYFVFKIKEGESTISIYGRGKSETNIKDGVNVAATGIFRKEKKIGDFTVKNEVDVSKVKDKPNGVQKVD